MVQSQNTQVAGTSTANLMSGGLGSKHGDLLIGDRAIEFYNQRNPSDFLQIPWQEIVRVRAQIFFQDRYIRGFFTDTKDHGSFNFVVKDAGHCLKLMRNYLSNEQIVRNKPTFSLKNFFKSKNK